MSAKESQCQFAARLREPRSTACLPGIAAERMELYEGLFFRNIEGFLSSGFPVLRRLVPDVRWQQIVRDFIASHRCRSPYFLDITQEFIDWLQQGYQAEADDPPFMLELAHYERVELALDIADVMLPPVTPLLGDLLSVPLAWSPLAWPLAYQWPVHQLGDSYRPVEVPATPTCLLAWRDRADKVRFMQLTAFAYQLALGLQAEQALQPLLQALAHQSGLTVDQAFLAQATGLLTQWFEQDILFERQAGTLS
ncbi:DNA-binding domain-containing protein [Halopseudomonas pelagia]|uniref:HvfC family RiPP maturation protein n=1 Tax=Halopseudomonas pelagia TaxID=553151 RepID=UPI0003B6BF14|nr:putative DNA-binding domain-containing protein [Halopseudomonas pelagia]